MPMIYSQWVCSYGNSSVEVCCGSFHRFYQGTEGRTYTTLHAESALQTGIYILNTE